MRKIGLLIITTLFVICHLTFVIPVSAGAQNVYTGLYWIAGNVQDPDGMGTEGRWVVFFERLENNSVVGGYADDYVGTGGLAGQTDKFMLNALEDFRLSVHPRTFYVAIVTGSDGYGADPVEVNVSGNGYDFPLRDLVLLKGAGINPPADRPSLLDMLSPKFDGIWFGNRKYQPALVAKGQEFIISASPRIKALAVSDYGINTSQIAMVLNEGTSTSKTYTIKSSHIVRAAGPNEAPTEVEFVYDFSSEQDELPEGTQNLKFKAANAYGATEEVCVVTVAGGEPRLIGIPITFPSPVRLLTDREVTFQYTLSHNIPIDIAMFDVSGRVVRRINYFAGDEGGSAGVNKVTWDLKTDQGQTVASGIYVFTIINKESGKLLGKGKFTALP